MSKCYCDICNEELICNKCNNNWKKLMWQDIERIEIGMRLKIILKHGYGVNHDKDITIYATIMSLPEFRNIGLSVELKIKNTHYFYKVNDFYKQNITTYVSTKKKMFTDEGDEANYYHNLSLFKDVQNRRKYE